ncbi:tRNA(Met) cytidine acetyltransferase TmcA [Caviibacterium pharyngocola]|uniref:tRNA(Met) cytidine acetyltransferase TmcA n=1 Tax=Caviibacterium pharyngocola TaxID=28159 RepID=A0A2M8RW90_9PAST|nr:tRNA(Met) cytidine acetyltransferase [Caviibacterium pharyngocola]
MLPRRLQFVLAQNLEANLLPPHLLWIGAEKPTGDVLFQSISAVRNLLGQEFDEIIFDCRNGFHCEALAIAAGTLKAGGTLSILLADWQGLAQQKDADSLRWSGESEPICTPNFVQRLQRLVQQYGFPRLNQNEFSQARPSQKSAVVFAQEISSISPPTAQQERIIRQILRQEAEIYFLTAKRGRGKSALLGLLANRLNARIFLTAPNKSAVNILNDFIRRDVEFIAPDELAALLRRDPMIYAQDWLFVDEAAMIPLALLETFSQSFKHIVFSTTIHCYEGTGRGFELKFKRKLHRTFQHFELTQPLRWRSDDAIETFIDELLLLNAEDRITPPIYHSNAKLFLKSATQQEVIRYIDDFYALLTAAHYRTAPLDLRRLLDARKQHFQLALSQEGIVGAVWATEEGGMQDQALIRDICRGTRRPKGNLAAQLLAFCYTAEQACRLTSLRVSRIAVQTNWQGKGIGRQLIKKVQREAKTDFLSVSFGYTEELANFWQKCGFNLVHFAETREASSGCYSALALYPLSENGKAFCQSLQARFARNLSLSFHPLAAKIAQHPIDFALNDDDLQTLRYFADFHLTLSAALPAIRRLVHLADQQNCPLLCDYLTNKQQTATLFGGRKNQLQSYREEVKKMLQKYKTLLLFDCIEGGEK